MKRMIKHFSGGVASYPWQNPSTKYPRQDGGHVWYDAVPIDSANNEILHCPIIARLIDGTRAQVTIRGGKCYHWEYRDTDKYFCEAVDVKEWRGCGGFDY